MKVVLKKGNDDEHAIRLENQAEEMLQATTLQHIQDNVSSWGGSEVPSWNDNEEDEDQTATPWLDEKQNNQKNVKNDTFSSSGKCSKRRRSNVAVIHVTIVFIGSYLFYCLLLNHSFQINTQTRLLTA